MNPEDRVLVGVIKTKRDFRFAQDQHWYRIPLGQAPKGIDAEVLAFFLSGKVFGELSGGIHHYAQRRGVELVRRKDLLPDGRPHKRDQHLYHKVQLSSLKDKVPPIWNHPNPHRFAFIYTTWDRFHQARHIRDLYSDADYFVDRVFHVLRQHGLKPLRSWDASRANAPYPSGAQIRVLAEHGDVVALAHSAEREGRGAEAEEGLIYLNPSAYLSDNDVKASARRIADAVQRKGGPRLIETPVELF